MEPLLKVSPSPITPLVPILVKKNQNIVLKSPFDTVYALIKITKIHVHGQLAFLNKKVIVFILNWRKRNK